MKKVLLAVITSSLMMFSFNAKADPLLVIPALIAVQGQAMVHDSQRKDEHFNKSTVEEKAKNANYYFTSTSCEYVKCSK